MMELYYGSNVIVEHPLVHVGRNELDFGPGFYVTQFQEQAVRWARRVCIVRKSKTPFLCKYSFDESLLPSDCKIKRMENYDIDWLEFIVNSRKNLKPWNVYDIIEGGVANDQVIDTVEDFYSGRISADQAIGQLKFAKPSHQICFSNQSIVDRCLHFEGYEQIK